MNNFTSHFEENNILSSRKITLFNIGPRYIHHKIYKNIYVSSSTNDVCKMNSIVRVAHTENMSSTNNVINWVVAVAFRWEGTDRSTSVFDSESSYFVREERNLGETGNEVCMPRAIEAARLHSRDAPGRREHSATGNWSKFSRYAGIRN